MFHRRCSRSSAIKGANPAEKRVVSLVVVGIAGNLPADTGDHDMSGLRSNPCVLARAEIYVTGVTGVLQEGARKRETIALSDPTRPAHVAASAVVVTLCGRLACQSV
jgi:hypothetical protein